MIQPILLEKLGALPESLQSEVLHFIEFLLERYVEKPAESVLPEKKRQAGLLQGKIWMADDFDEPLEDFREYM